MTSRPVFFVGNTGSIGFEKIGRPVIVKPKVEQTNRKIQTCESLFCLLSQIVRGRGPSGHVDSIPNSGAENSCPEGPPPHRWRTPGGAECQEPRPSCIQRDA